MEKSEREIKLQETAARIVSDRLRRIIVSRPLTKGELTKVMVRPVLIRGGILFQETRYIGTKAVHENYDAVRMQNQLVCYLSGMFGQLEAECIDKKVTILTNKKGTVTVREKKQEKTAGDGGQGQDPAAIAPTANALTENVLTTDVMTTDVMTAGVFAHDRRKNHILKDGEAVDFLVALGVQTPDGKVVKSKCHKFKQINRYLEFVEDILPVLQKEETIRIVDFGCGKSYLTFALYYYLKIKQNKNIDIIGLDLKKDVIEDCNALKDKLGYQGLRFVKGDIKDYENTDKIDMVVSLHACDTATDYALAKAVAWDAKVIMAVPCCQHELNRQIACAPLQEILKYGVIKERIAALMTDAYRADCLEQMGYETQILEFIDLEHTPKNLLIRAVRKEKKIFPKKNGKKYSESLEELEHYLHIHPLLGRLIEKR